MNKNHVHSFRKIASKLYCTSPECFHKYSPFEIHGHFVKCAQCNAHFIYNMDNYGPKDYQITCAHCNPKLPYILTLEEQRLFMAGKIREEVLASLRTQADKIEMDEKFLEKKEKELIEWGNRLVRREDSLHKREEKIKEKRQKLSFQINERRKKLHGKVKERKVEAEKVILQENIPIDTTPGEIILDEIAKLLGKNQ